MLIESPPSTAWRIVPVLFAVGFAGACTVQRPRDRLASDVYFGPRFQEGRVAVYQLVWDNSSTEELEGRAQVTTDHAELTLRVSIDRVSPNGSADGTLTYDHVLVRGEALRGAAYAFDSNASQPDPQTDPNVTAALRLLANSTVRFHADAKGRVDPAEVTGTESACEAMQKLEVLRGRVAAFDSDGIADLLESTWRVGEEGFVRNIDKPWKEVGARPFDEETQWLYRHTYTPVSQTPEHVIIDLQMDMSLTPESPHLGFELREGAFRYVWDRRRHEVIERAGSIEFDWEILQHTFPESILNQRQRMMTSLSRVDE